MGNILYIEVIQYYFKKERNVDVTLEVTMGKSRLAKSLQFHIKPANFRTFILYISRFRTHLVNVSTIV